jgi:hypothetical protein
MRMKDDDMPTATKLPLSLRAIATVIILLGIAMGAYWGLFLARKMEVGDIPILSECVNAVLALLAGIGILARKPWALPCGLVLSGMWAYGVIAGIGVVLRRGLDFSSPFGAQTDAVLFPLILLFSIYSAVAIWRHRGIFEPAR